MNKTIWMLWLQGRDQAPEIIQRCIQSWEQKNPNWTVKCLSASTVQYYIDVSRFIDLENQQLQAASVSDIIRVMLLHEYGGVWADASTLCNISLDDWLQDVVQTGFFAFKLHDFPNGDRPLSSWFLAARQGNSLVGKWASRVHKYWKDRPSSDDYFWFHHQFYELLETDAIAARDWNRVPKLSADGPHSIQSLSGGMHQPYEQAVDRIDWSTPLFKLTYRLNPTALEPGTILSHALDRCSPPAPTITSNKAPVDHRRDCAAYRLSTENLGDHIQLIASDGLMKRAGFEIQQRFDRDTEMESGGRTTDKNVPILINGWHKHGDEEWPPNEIFDPVFLGFHIRPHQCARLLSQEAIDYYKKHGPIGCRDVFTFKELSSRGVDCFVSNCLSLTFPRRLPKPEEESEVFVASRDERILDAIPPFLGPVQFIKHYSDTSDSEDNMESAFELIELYRNKAKLIVTTLLHCALPAIAMGIPVVVLYPHNGEASHQSDQERFSSLSRMVRVYSFQRSEEIDWSGHLVDTSAQKLKLIEEFLNLSRKWSVEPHPLGPIAQSTILPVPKTNIWLEKRKEREKLRQRFFSDGKKWGDAKNYNPNWRERAELAQGLIPSGAKVLELGKGAGDLARMIEHRTNYTGSDLSPLDKDTLRINIDTDPLPDDLFDYIVFLGVFEYLATPQKAARKICNRTSNVLATYCCRSSDNESIAIRRSRGWATDFSELEFVSLFEANQFRVVDKIKFNETADFTQSVFHFRRC